MGISKDNIVDRSIYLYKVSFQMTNKTCNYLQDIHDNWNYLDIHEIHSGHIYQQGNISAIVQHNVLSYYECDNGRLAKQLFDTFYVLILLWEHHLEIKYE